MKKVADVEALPLSSHTTNSEGLLSEKYGRKQQKEVPRGVQTAGLLSFLSMFVCMLSHLIVQIASYNGYTFDGALFWTMRLFWISFYAFITTLLLIRYRDELHMATPICR
ncbi:hypothetical protein CAAN1_04S00386 [[Candida] anglica]|uniref:Uncharacterized protein n=1 Tax=[Candida] anglica TaxID=148631 RepID=A0ABP0EAI4_9ASCO